LPKETRGYVFVTTAICAAVLIEFVGLAADVGYVEWQRLRAQAAADAAAAGALFQLQQGAGNAAITSAAQADAALNGFTNGMSNTAVTVNHPPLNGSLAGNSSAVEVIVHQTVRTFFLSVIGQSQAGVAARAVETLGAAANAACVYALNPSASRAFQINGGNADYFTCGLQVASSSATALHMEGSAILYMENGAGVSVVGGLDLTGQTKILTYPGNQTVTPGKISALADPLGYVTAPSATGMTQRGASNTYYDMNKKPPNNAIPQGVYCGGLTVGNTGGATFTMSGVYIMAGGGFTFNSQASISGSGVTIYNTSGPNSGVAGCAAAFSPLTISGQANVTLSAPTTGSLAGMLIFQDRSITSASNNQINGGATTNLTGAIYLLHSPLLFSGTNTSSGYMILVADTVTINGNSTVYSNYSSLPGGSPIRGTAVLAE
jgi:hypothetical protein